MTNRFSLVFNGLNDVLARAANSPIAGIRERYQAVAPAFARPGWNTQQILELSLHSVAVPNVVIAHEDIHRFNDSTKQLTKFEPMEMMNVTFYDYINGSATAIIEAWKALCGDKKTGAIGFKEDYILPTASFFDYGPNAPAEDVPTAYAEFRMVNLYPASLALGEHSYEQGGTRKIQCQFAMDNLYPIFMKGRPVA